ncbi:peptidylprolyl isomerase [Flavobacteriaceae bacterium]|nr:peptidylprolyl isomerase [Flavobacteriaceae bacterium]MDB4264011.1 peptidylprolyl isomerase [Flavobacteriaceae bacterium]
MSKTKILIFFLIGLFTLTQCTSKKNVKKSVNKAIKKEEVKKEQLKEEIIKKEEFIVLNDENAIPFFFEYQKENHENKVRISTRFGNIDIKLYENTPYHRSNFIYLTKRGYFNGTTFHRVVPEFIIQGGNSDRMETSKKRGEIGKYLLPPDTRKGHKHHRGVISMPSSEIENPYKLASPYEFFIVQQSPGAYHLDGSYTVFGEVISGMDVVDKINKQNIDDRETPLTNIFMEVSILK